jgi:hypothetical protein
MRSIAGLLAVIVLAAAAGAGDDVKWDNSDEIPYAGLDSDGSAASVAYDEEVARYSVGWLPAAGKTEIDFIEATYYGWGLHCSRLKAAVADGKCSESAFFYEIERSKDIFRNFIIFYVTISARAQPDTNLANPRRWTIYLERGEEPLEPVLMTEDKNAPRGAIVRYLKEAWIPPAMAAKNKFTKEDLEYIYSRCFEDIVWHRKTYKVAFVNTSGEPPRENLRLVITGDKAQRGFEWRFEEE